MKKTAERILILTSFLIGLIMLFLICTPTIKSEPFIRTYDLLQDGIIEPIKNFTDSIQDGSGNINADTITADTITAAQLNIINIDLTTISGTTALYLNLDVTDTADITEIKNDTLLTKIIQFDTNYYMDNHTTLMGEVRWNYEDGTLDIGMNGGNVIQQTGLELLARVKNQSGEKINNGEVVMYSGTLGVSGVLLVKKAFGNINAQYVIGIATEDIENDSFGFITTFGKVRGINTTGSLYSETWLDSQVLWYNPDTAGALTNVKPAYPKTQAIMGVVIKAHHTNGQIFVRPTYPTDTTILILKGDNISVLKNDSDFASYNDTLFFQVSNTDTIYSDTSITADTQMDVINDTACLIISDTSAGVNLDNFKYNYEVKINGVWQESSQLVYYDDIRKRVVFKADISIFAPNTIKFNFWRVKK